MAAEIFVRVWNEGAKQYEDAMGVIEHSRLNNLPHLGTVLVGKGANVRAFLINPSKNRHDLGGPHAGSF